MFGDSANSRSNGPVLIDAFPLVLGAGRRLLGLWLLLLASFSFRIFLRTLAYILLLFATLVHSFSQPRLLTTNTFDHLVHCYVFFCYLLTHTWHRKKTSHSSTSNAIANPLQTEHGRKCGVRIYQLVLDAPSFHNQLLVSGCTARSMDLLLQPRDSIFAIARHRRYATQTTDLGYSCFCPMLSQPPLCQHEPASRTVRSIVESL